MNLVVFGATGMVGSGVLLEALADPVVGSVLAVGRSPTGLSHPKLRELRRTDFLDGSAFVRDLADRDACLFCLGVSSFRMSEREYHRITHDFTLAVAEALLAANPDAVFCYVSGAGTDASERGRVMWARVKGKTENALLRLPFRGAYMFRPGWIQPLEGVRSKTTLYRLAYDLAGFLYPVLERVVPDRVTTSRAVGRAMVRVAQDGYPAPILETKDINALAQVPPGWGPGPSAPGGSRERERRDPPARP